MTEPDDRGVTDEEIAAMMSPRPDVEEIRKLIPDYVVPGPPMREDNDTTNESEITNREVSQATESSGPKKMPWALWTNGERHEVVQGVDISITIGDFRSRLHNMAHRRDMFVYTRKLGRYILEFQFCKTEAERDLAKYQEDLPKNLDR
jgi:hypothetical protein